MIENTKKIQKRILVEIVTVGIPFILFKALLGYHIINLGFSIGYLFIIWGVIDLFINIYNLISNLFTGDSSLRTCFFNYVVKYILKILPIEHIGQKDLGTALDIFLSFLIVAYMIGTGSLSTLSPLGLNLWNIAVILNVLGAGLMRLRDSAKRIQIKI